MTFTTQDLAFASFLHASRKLRFVGCEPVDGNGRIAFVFDDPAGDGARLHIEFESGAECPAATFYDSVRHLRRIMTRIQSNGVLEHARYP